jgi:beta-lactamase class A
VYVAGGTDLIDAPLASAAAAATDRGALLVDGLTAAADAATLAALRGVKATRVVIVGGTSAVSDAYQSSLAAAGFAVERRNGVDRYNTAVIMAKEGTGAAQRAIVANPESPADVAVAAALAGATRQPLLYVMQLCAPDGTAAYLAAAGLPVTAVGGPTWVGPDTLAGKSCTTVRTQRQASLVSAIKATAAKYAGTYNVSVRQIGGLGESVNISGATLKEPASMMKIFAAWAAFTRIQQGRASSSTKLPSGVTLGVCIHVMIQVSDNYCHTDIVHWIGISQINSMIRNAGFANTKYGTVAPGVSVLYAGNRTTTNDLTSMVQKLVNGTVLSRSLSDRLLGEMKGQIWRSRIASGIPPGVVQASKPGALWIASGLLQADTAVIYGKKGTYTLSIIGDDNPPKAALRAISRTVYEHFNGAFGAAATYPVQQMVTKVSTNVRTSPAGPVATVAAKGTLIEVIDAVRDWYLVRWGTRQLYIHYSALRLR